MTREYVENALLFINSTDSCVPHGRNARAQARTKQAAKSSPARALGGQFGCLDLSTKRPSSETGCQTNRKRRQNSEKLNRKTSDLSLESDLENGRPNAKLSNTYAYSAPIGSSTLNPSEVLTIAAFHIRRIAAITIRTEPDRLVEAVRCRQWSCVKFAIQRFGNDPCLDSALLCVASKLGYMSGCAVSSLSVLSSYSEALQRLQAALKNPAGHEHVDLLTTMQLLAVYEMLDSPTNPQWAKHIAGAESLVPLQLSIQSTSIAQPLSDAYAAPMFTDALLTGDYEYFERAPWRTLLQNIVDETSPLPKNWQMLMSCLFELPVLLLETKKIAWDPSSASKFDLLDRVFTMKVSMKDGLLEGDLYTHDNYNSLAAFDKLGMCIAGLLSLHRIVILMKPELQCPGLEDPRERLEELCNQMLQLELGVVEAEPASEVMAAFEQQGSMIKNLPTRLGARYKPWSSLMPRISNVVEPAMTTTTVSFD